MKKQLFFLGILLVLPLHLISQEIYVWHAFEGFIEEKFSEIVEDFNSQSETYRVIPVRKGNYAETYERGIEASQKGSPPHILQVYEVATLSMMLSPDHYVPVEALMKRYNNRFDSHVYIDVVRKFYSD